MKLAHNYYVYIVECRDGFYYTGVTNDLNRRIAEHNEGISTTCYTDKRRPVALRYYAHFTDVLQAIAYEKNIKGWRRAKKKALINDNISLLKELAKNNVRDKE